jgi:hypothetical protein
LDDLPHVKDQGKTHGHVDHIRGLVIDQIQQDNGFTNEVDIESFDADSLHRVFFVPELDIIFESQDLKNGVQNRDDHSDTDQDDVALKEHPFKHI